ncbi:MAG: hypothetical protein MJ237_07255 [bacterium]|nr:hypothetical protein [bacterium]
MRRNIAVIMLLTCLVVDNAVYSAANYSYEQNQTMPQSNVVFPQPSLYASENTLNGRVVMVPAGISVKAVLTAPISSEYTEIGQTVTLATGSDFYYENTLIAPAGSTITGTVIQASKAKHGSINGKICVRFNQICTPQGVQIPISAIIKTEDLSGVLVGGTNMDITKSYAKDLTIGSATGALSGLVFGALAGGNVGRGAALGTAVGAGGGLAKSVWDKGNDVEIPSGASVDIVLTQPISVSSTSYAFEN